MVRYWLKCELKCFTPQRCGKCKKVLECLEAVKDGSEKVAINGKTYVVHDNSMNCGDYRYSKEHSVMLKNLVPDKAFKDSRKCEKRISCNNCNGYLKCKGGEFR